MGTKKILMCLLLLMMILPLASAAFTSLGTFPTKEDVRLVQLCGDCTYNNITSIVYPNSSVALSGLQMTKDGTEFFYLLDAAYVEDSGTYTVNGVGDPAGADTIWAYMFTITSTGTDLTIGEAVLYILLAISVFGIFLISLYFNITIPYRNKQNDYGQIINITKTKYLKIGLIWITYSLLVWFLNILIGISVNFINLEMSYGIINILFIILNNLSLPLSIFIIVWGLIEIIRDLNLWKTIEKFGVAN